MNRNSKRLERGLYWDRAWSLVEGCTPVSKACDNCWLKVMDKRFHRGGPGKCREDRLRLPLKVKKPTTWCIWSDLFHETVPASFITHAFEVMEACPQHTFLMLTKRPERLEPVLYGLEGGYFLGGGDYIKNIWLGTTVETQKWADIRIPQLLKCRPFSLWVSIEPILEEVVVPEGLDWIVAGCETGPQRRKAKIDWFRTLAARNFSLWIKQIEINGKVSHDMSEWPADLRIREMP